MRRNKIRLNVLVLMASFLAFTATICAQDNPTKLTDFWKIGEVYDYQITLWKTVIGHVIGKFDGIAEDSTGGKAFLFTTKTLINLPGTKAASEFSSKLYTQSKGFPGIYQADYLEDGKKQTLWGYLYGIDFKFVKTVDTGKSEFSVNISPGTMLCDRQAIPQWNLVFYNAKDLDKDTLQFSILIPYLEKRAIMRMVRQPDETIPVLGKPTVCKVYFSLRTDEYYYITPEKKVARVTLPSQKLEYNLAGIKMTEPEIKSPK